MQHQAEVLQHFPFAGKQRKPGDMIASADWMAATDAVKSALIGGNYVRLVGDNDQQPVRSPRRDTATASELNTDHTLLLQEISAKQDRILEGLAKLGVNATTKPAKSRKRRATGAA